MVQFLLLWLKILLNLVCSSFFPFVIVWLRNYRWQLMNKIQNHVKERKEVLIKRWQKTKSTKRKIFVDFVSSTSILFGALFCSGVVNSWRYLTETLLLNFLSLLRQSLSVLAFFWLSAFVFAVGFGLRVFVDPLGVVHLCWPESSNWVGSNTVCNHSSDFKNRTTAEQESDLIITS